MKQYKRLLVDLYFIFMYKNYGYYIAHAQQNNNVKVARNIKV